VTRHSLLPLAALAAALASCLLLSSCGGGGPEGLASPTVDTAAAVSLTVGGAPVAGSVLQGQAARFAVSLQTATTYVATLQPTPPPRTATCSCSAPWPPGGP